MKKLTACCGALVQKQGDTQVCYSCRLINPTTVEVRDWDLVAVNTWRLPVEGGYLYKIYWDKARLNKEGSDKVPVITFIPTTGR